MKLRRLNNIAGLFLILMLVSIILVGINPYFSILTILLFLLFWLFNVIYAFKNKDTTWAVWILVTILAFPVAFGVSLVYFIVNRYNLTEKLKNLIKS